MSLLFFDLKKVKKKKLYNNSYDFILKKRSKLLFCKKNSLNYSILARLYLYPKKYI